MMWAWCTSRSSTAVARIGSANILPHSSKGLLRSGRALRQLLARRPTHDRRDKELLGQADFAEHLEAMRNIGAWFFDPELCTFVPSITGTPEEAVGIPHLMGSTRKMVLAGTWLSGSALFSYQPPRFCFSPSQQRLLTAALQGCTDFELSQRLQTSVSFVRRCCLSIYDRVAARAPEVLGEQMRFDDNRESGRGKGKKHRLLAYLRDHPEELRPTSRKGAMRTMPQELYSAHA
jgi:hypothetical protein